jgi:hypothetical protein
MREIMIFAFTAAVMFALLRPILPANFESIFDKEQR